MDDGSTIQYLLLLLLLLFTTAYFAGTEISLASVNRIRIMSLADNGDRRAKRVLLILNNFDKALTTLLIGTNLAQISSATVATYLATKLWGVDAVAAATVVLTLILFLFGEMLPKYFAKACNERFALSVAGSLLFFMRIFSPVSAVFSKLSEWVSRPFRREEEDPTVTEDELYDLVETAAQEGVMDEEKSELVQSALEFSERTAKDILLPWNKVVSVSAAMTEEEIGEVIRAATHSRFPVLDINGNVIGVLQIRRYLKACIQEKEEESPQIRALMEDAQFIRSDTAIDDLLPLMSQNKNHMSFVLDGNGDLLGIVTVEDILEELVGEIYDEDDPEGGAA